VTPENTAGKEAYAKCAGCHGVDGQTKALGKANAVAGQTAAALAEALQGYKAGTRNVSGMGMLMKGQVASMDDETITAVSEYMSGL
jgi:cytochrome c553